jgi:hypothetical protein
MDGFRLKRIDKAGNESIIEAIHEDYHNGKCIFMVPSGEHETLSEDLNYLVVDFADHLVLIYPGGNQEDSIIVNNI